MARLHTGIFVALTAMLTIAVIPLGSNRPFFWALNGLIVAVVAMVYVVGTGGRRRHPRVALRALAVPAALVGATILWLVVQMLPYAWGSAAPRAWALAANALERPLAPSLSVDPGATFGMLIRYLSYALVFVLAAQISMNAARAHRLLEVVFWLVFASAAYGIIALLVMGDTVLLMPKWSYEGYATGFFVNRNHFATFLGFGAAIGTGLFMEALGYGSASGAARKSAGPGWDALVQAGGLYGTGVAVIATCIALTGSRMGAAASTLGVATVFALTIARARGQRRMLWLWLLAAVVLGGLVLAFSGQRVLDRVGSIETSSDERMMLYSQTTRMIVERPLSGFGGGSFEDAFQIFHTLPLSADVVWDKAHNLYLELLADLGIVGLLPLIAALWIAVPIVSGALRADHMLPYAAALGTLLIAAVHSLVDFSLQIEAIVFTFLIVIAVGFGQALSSARERAALPALPSLRSSRRAPQVAPPATGATRRA